MRRTRANLHLASIIIVAVLAAACSATPSPAPTASAAVVAANDAPVTLRLAIADPLGRQSEPAVRDLVTRVQRLSGGNVTIEPTFDASGVTTEDFEERVAALVKRGDAELGLVGARVWDLAGVTSLQALQAPFLIDNDALALAVAKSDIATRALAGLSAAGVEGLAMWPEDLRHLFWFPHCPKDLRWAKGVAGSSLVVIRSGAGRALVESLGGVVWTGTDRGIDADACVLHGMEAGLKGVGLPLSTARTSGNVVVFPKYQVLVGNQAALQRLSATQRSILEQAGRETQADAFGRQPSDAILAKDWCSQGGSVVLSPGDQVAAFVAAAKPVSEVLEQDTLTRELIAAIRELKQATPPSPGAQACTAPVVAPSFAISDPTGYLGTMPPDGVYRADLTREDLLARGATARFAAMNWGVKTWTFRGGKVTLDQGENGGPPCDGTYESVEGRFVRFITKAGGCGFDQDVVWRLEGDGISMIVLSLPTMNAIDFTDNQAYMERVWTRID